MGITSTIYITDVCGDLVDQINIVILYISQKDTNKTKEELQTTIDDFEKRRPVLNVFLGQGETNEIRGDLNKAIFYINYGVGESSILFLQECKIDLNRIITSTIPTISTIL